MNAMTPEMESLESNLKATWMAGDYGYFAKYLEQGALEFLARMPIEPGTRMLDVAYGARIVTASNAVEYLASGAASLSF